METLKRTLHSNQIHVSIHPEFHRRRLITTLFKAFVVWQQTTCISTTGGTHSPNETPGRVSSPGDSFPWDFQREKKLQVYLSIDDKR